MYHFEAFRCANKFDNKYALKIGGEIFAENSVDELNLGQNKGQRLMSYRWPIVDWKLLWIYYEINKSQDASRIRLICEFWISKKFHELNLTSLFK